MPKLNYKVRLKNFLSKHASRNNSRLRLRDDKKLLFDEIFYQLMILEEAAKKAPSKATSPENRVNGPKNPEEILFWHFQTIPVYLPDWSGFSKAELLYFKSRFEQLMGDLT